MKAFHYFLLWFLMLNANLFSQTAVSGYVTLEHPEKWENKVYLSKIDQDEKKGNYNATTIASASLDKDGFFAFDQQVFDTKNQLYKIQLQPLSVEEKKKLSDRIKNFRVFITSKKDTVFFNKSKVLFGSYTTSSKADQELQKLKRFEARYENLTSDFDPKQYLLETKGYVKDSLQILLVKLVGIKSLDDQNLLDKDIKKNPEYYIDFLKELKSSELDPSTYMYLENKLAFITQELTTKKYHMSLWGNGIAFLIIMVLVCFIFISKKKQTNRPISLSKQEQIVKDLILLGKSNKEIANELFVSISTVKTHISNIYGKLNISNRQELLSKK